MKELDNYLKNKLSEKQEEKITKALFQRHFDEEMKNRWSKELSDKYNVLPSGQTKNTFSRRKWLLMAASLILGLISVFLYQNTMKQNTTQLADEHLAKIYTHIGLKKGIETDEMRTNAIDAYNTNDYAKTILLYEKIIASEDKTIEDFFFCGLSYLYSGQAVKAIPLFQEGLLQTFGLRKYYAGIWH